jgi:hypothetical protein
VSAYKRKGGKKRQPISFEAPADVTTPEAAAWAERSAQSVEGDDAAEGAIEPDRAVDDEVAAAVEPALTSAEVAVEPPVEVRLEESTLPAPRQPIVLLANGETPAPSPTLSEAEVRRFTAVPGIIEALAVPFALIVSMSMVPFARKQSRPASPPATP